MRRRGISRRRADAGFTLLELLLALSLLSVLTSALLGGLHLGRKAFEAGRVQQAAGDLEAAATALSNLLAQAFPLVALDANGVEAPSFTGHPDGCSFVSLSEGDVQRGGLVATEIGLEPNRQGVDLAVWSGSIRGEGLNAATRNTMRKTEAVRNIAALRLSYFGEIEVGKPPRWSETWIGNSRLPQLVSVRLGAFRSGQPLDVSFFVALRQLRQ